ncbi:Acetoacetate decarboxylase (ADC) (plasmid) [Tsukamurella tyrosinosolvens]|uniref:Acetoacetate decarboxylase (ADC) n=1 Tax=Tsukamurella tyrosinosolvens TaxID=57704 RepID=A0A1H4SJE5_TSUTY|nr:acetoacetate decarboxylase family protein [Tsukamurella tyrosinosolvens]KXO93449.1 acetoacetate decarboxylase [Tsukamurella tyrosinosolvens]SEC44223.1 Acetoacetate decarboxylase (ADC) [Tsukamurella tyrosinosolvens]VEH96471.1 Acetoacetate decarboxylase (ADC) [Tsukamurella tyrosinosolvens]
MTAAATDTVEVDLGGRTVRIPRDGLYDRYRMDTPLDEIAADPRVRDVDFFRALPKARVDSPIGPTRTPNFYYAMSSARLTMLAPTRAIRRRLPEELTPLEVAPGLGLVSVMFFRYDVCDIDFYTEAAVGVAVRPARHGGPGVADLASALGGDHLHSYVLSLPVNTEIAQVRGHDGYGFPKWVTDLDVDITAASTSARVATADGGVDLAFSARTPRQRAHASGAKVSTLTSYTRRGNAWFATLNQTNVLATGTSPFPRGIDLTLGEGRMSDDVRSLRPIRAIALDVNTGAQAALHMPVPISVR